MYKKDTPPTIEDVARQAGVSIATVSRVLNGSTTVVPETADRVRAAIDNLRYVPRTAARVLASRKTNTIGLLIPEISGAFFPPMLRGIEAGVRESGFDLLIHTTHSMVHPESYRRPLGEHNTDGLIIFPESIDQKELMHLYELGFPVVLLHQTPPPQTHIPFVTVENKSGAEMLIDHLIEVHGRRRVAYLQGPEGHEDSLWRERGYRLSLEAHGIAFDPGLIGYGGFDEDDAYDAIQQWLIDGLEFDAVFTGDDDAAVGVLRALSDAKISVPVQVSVVGFDDVPHSRFLIPPLTTVRAPIEQVGHEAVHQLVNCIREKRCDPETLLPTELIIRQSCGCT